MDLSHTVTSPSIRDRIDKYWTSCITSSLLRRDRRVVKLRMFNKFLSSEGTSNKCITPSLCGFVPSVRRLFQYYSSQRSLQIAVRITSTLD